MHGSSADTRVPRLFILAGGGAVLLYAALSFVIAPPAAQPPETLRLLFWIFSAVAIADFAVGILMERRLVRGRPGMPATADSRLRSAVIVSVAFAVSIAVYGLVLFLLGSDQAHFWPFIGASLLYLVLLSNRLDSLAVACGDDTQAH